MITLNTERPNFTRITLFGTTFWFSYATCIAFTTNTDELHIVENVWGPTTGHHLNMIDKHHKKRMPKPEFDIALGDYLEDVFAALLVVRDSNPDEVLDAIRLVRNGLTPAQIDNVIERLQAIEAELEERK